VITTTVVPRRAARPRVTLRIPPYRHRPLPSFPSPFLSDMQLCICTVYCHSRDFYRPGTAPVCGLRHRTCSGEAAHVAATALLSRLADTWCEWL